MHIAEEWHARAAHLSLKASELTLTLTLTLTLKNGGQSRAAQARARLEMALEISERKSKPEEYDEHLVAFVDGSCFPPSGCKTETRENCENQSRKRKQIEMTDGREEGAHRVGCRSRASKTKTRNRRCCGPIRAPAKATGSAGKQPTHLAN